MSCDCGMAAVRKPGEKSPACRDYCAAAHKREKRRSVPCPNCTVLVPVSGTGRGAVACPECGWIWQDTIAPFAAYRWSWIGDCS